MTPPAIIVKLNDGIVRVLENSEVKERLGSIGLVAAGSTPERTTT